MMLIFDACSLINLTNGQVLSTILALEICTVGPIVRGEVTLPEIEDAVACGLMRALDDGPLSSEPFLRLIEEERLGEGESECISAALQMTLSVCSDDDKARKVGRRLLGEDRVTGSLGLLRKAVRASRLTSDQAHEAYRRMLLCGAFLPSISIEFFASGLSQRLEGGR